MKNLSIFLLLTVTLAITSFTNHKTVTSGTRYAFVTDLEFDKAFDEPGITGVVTITTNIVNIDCDLEKYEVASQYMDHYEAEERTKSRERAFRGASGITNAWIYDTHDEALESRRNWLAKDGDKHKRRIEHFYVTCK